MNKAMAVINEIEGLRKQLKWSKKRCAKEIGISYAAYLKACKNGIEWSFWSSRITLNLRDTVELQEKKKASYFFSQTDITRAVDEYFGNNLNTLVCSNSSFKAWVRQEIKNNTAEEMIERIKLKLSSVNEEGRQEENDYRNRMEDEIERLNEQVFNLTAIVESLLKERVK